MTTTQIIISGIVGLITGALGSLVAPWVNWGIEKRKLRRKTRITLLKELNLYVLKNNVQTNEFLTSYNYIRIRPYLSNKLIEGLEMD